MNIRGLKGFWWSELTHPYFMFKEAGYDVQLFCPEGGKCEADGMSDLWRSSGTFSLHRRYSPHITVLEVFPPKGGGLFSLPHRIFEYGLVVCLAAALSAGNLDRCTGIVDDLTFSRGLEVPPNRPYLLQMNPRMQSLKPFTCSRRIRFFDGSPPGAANGVWGSAAGDTDRSLGAIKTEYATQGAGIHGLRPKKEETFITRWAIVTSIVVIELRLVLRSDPTVLISRSVAHAIGVQQRGQLFDAGKATSSCAVARGFTMGHPTHGAVSISGDGAQIIRVRGHYDKKSR